MRGAEAPRRVGVVATAVNQLGIRGVVEPPSRETPACSAEAGTRVGAGRVLDPTLAGTRYAAMKAADALALET